MKKELIYCSGVLLRADLTGHGRPTLFGRNLLYWPCLLRSALKRTPVQDFNFFSVVFYYIVTTTYQKIWDLFCSVHISGLSRSVKAVHFSKKKMLILVRNSITHLNLVRRKPFVNSAGPVSSIRTLWITTQYMHAKKQNMTKFIKEWNRKISQFLVTIVMKS